MYWESKYLLNLVCHIWTEKYISFSLKSCDIPDYIVSRVPLNGMGVLRSYYQYTKDMMICTGRGPLKGIMHFSSNPLAGKPVLPRIPPENLRSIGPPIAELQPLRSRIKSSFPTICSKKICYRMRENMKGLPNRSKGRGARGKIPLYSGHVQTRDWIWAKNSIVTDTL